MKVPFKALRQLRFVRFASLASVVTVLAVQPACQSEYFGRSHGGTRLTVELLDAENVAGTRLRPLPLKVNTPQPFKVKVTAIAESGGIDTAFNGFVRMTSKPGAIERIDSPDADGRNLRLTNGVSPEVTILVSNAYGTTFIIADDLGYAPADPIGTPPPACADGLDNDGDGKVDFPTDEGCAFANDNSETGGAFSQGSTQPIYYALPRIADARGLICDAEGKNCSGTGKTPYPREQLLLDTGLRERADGSQRFDFDMVVTRIASSGFFVQDTKDKRKGAADNDGNEPPAGFTGVFAFNFNAPPGMRVCDRLKTFTGTATEFFGFTQISYPTWTVEPWDPSQRPCLVPEPTVLEWDQVGHPVTNDRGETTWSVPTTLLPRTATLIRVISDDAAQKHVSVTAHFGPDKVQADPVTKLYTPTDNASNCDFSGDGQIDFSMGSEEAKCNERCTIDTDCTEYSNFISRGTFRMKVALGDLSKPETLLSGAVQVDASARSEFKPVESKGKQIKSFSGIMTYFSGGSQFTIEARCPDDIIVELDQQPIPSDKACVTPRTDLEENPQ